MTDYDEHADVYRNWYQSDSPYWEIEQTRFFEVLGSVHNRDILELACGDGRISQLLMDRGARSVRGVDISDEMIQRAIAQNTDPQGKAVYPGLSFVVLDAGDETFTLDKPVDLVAAMYLFHYASSKRALGQMCELISRNLKPGGRFVAFTLNPNYDFSRQDARMASCFGFSYRVIDLPHCHLIFNGQAFNMWHWSQDDHETALKDAGLTGIQWHQLCPPNDDQEFAKSFEWYFDNPGCIVVSAEKPT